uniref:DNA2/NAM7 helicase-like C-terminal domain-containing protein n=1 Tax=Panagrolaimus sp. ES5 TaxID=591445 RepID=A0AC34FDV3_9BILA
MVPEEQWVCGATQWDRGLAYQRTNESCQDVSCYILDKSQAECDDPFCQCLEEQAKLSNNPECEAALEGFCFIVRLLGGIAHANAKEKSEEMLNSNLTLIESLTTTTPVTTTTSTTTTTLPSTFPPKKLDITEEECFSSELNNCVAEFETCQSKDKAELLQCEERMCQCTRSALRNQAKPECRYPIEMTCIIPDSSIPSSESETLNIQTTTEEEESWLSREIIIFGFSATIFTALIFLICTSLPIAFGIWTLYRYFSKQSMPISPSQTPLCAASSAESGFGCVQRMQLQFQQYPGMTVDTVERFQGSERRVIIMTTVRTDAVGFLQEYRRFNTAITRCKHMLIVIGDARLLIKDPVWK